MVLVTNWIITDIFSTWHLSLVPSLLRDSQVMACEVNFDLVPFTHWEKDKEALELSDRLIQLPSGALVISNASETDAGLYRCVVENVGSSKSSDEALLQTIPVSLRPDCCVKFHRQEICNGSNTLLPVLLGSEELSSLCWRLHPKVLMLLCRCYPKSFMGEELDLQTVSSSGRPGCRVAS
ncbi:hypothetical protein XENOCAPTIV_009648 [Xenoophorus captivus]|uniref:Ig-like domain-containing protein n=1 Tax=Xenoophorus captivus TaxID=1517983 RepID=A0ABV0QZH7_9TELE